MVVGVVVAAAVEVVEADAGVGEVPMDLLPRRVHLQQQRHHRQKHLPPRPRRQRLLQPNRPLVVEKSRLPEIAVDWN